MTQIFEQTIQINTTAAVVERCITEPLLMQRWLNPLLSYEPIGDSSTHLGAKSRFVIQIPIIKPTLNSTIVERQPGLVVWSFDGFFKGRDRWECQPIENGTRLINRFEFEIPNPIVSWGFKVFAEQLTKEDMNAQLRRLKLVAETLTN